MFFASFFETIYNHDYIYMLYCIFSGISGYLRVSPISPGISVTFRLSPAFPEIPEISGIFVHLRVSLCISGFPEYFVYNWISPVSLGISRYLRLSSAICGHLWESPVSGYLHVSPGISGYLRVSPGISGYLRVSPGISGYLRICSGISGQYISFHVYIYVIYYDHYFVHNIAYR